MAGGEKGKSSYFEKTMLSAGILHSIRLIFKIGGALGSFPYEWDSKLGEAKLKRSRFSILRWKFIIVYILFNTVFMTVRLAQAACCMETTYGKLFMNLYNVITWSCTSAFQINTFLHTQHFPEFINHLIRTNRHFQLRKHHDINHYQ